GTLGTAAMAAMDERLSWFAAMSAENRSWLGLVAQAGIAAFVDWVKHPERARPAVTGEVFGTAPRELARAVSLQQAVEMVRVILPGRRDRRRGGGGQPRAGDRRSPGGRPPGQIRPAGRGTRPPPDRRRRRGPRPGRRRAAAGGTVRQRADRGRRPRARPAVGH